MRNVARSLWASVQRDPVVMRRVDGWFTIFCLDSWCRSRPDGCDLDHPALSIWALVSGHW